MTILKAFALIKLILVLWFAAFNLLASAHPQLSRTRVKFSPEYPNQNQSLKLSYKVDSAIFLNKDKIFCKVFFTGENLDGFRLRFPQVFELSLHEESGLLCGSLELPAQATGMVAVFLDSLEVKVDNNNGEGYWTPVFIGIDLLAGSLSSIADLYAGSWPHQYFLNERRDIARRLYEKDFRLYPGIKRKFTRYYLTTFDIYDTVDRRLYLEELKLYSQNEDLSEEELLGVRRYYSIVNEVDSARKYEKLIFDRYPNGSWALQVNSLKPAMQIDQMKKQREKWEGYKEFKRKYGGDYPDEFTRKQMHDREGQILRGMFLSFAQNNDLATWQKAVDELDDWSRYYTYDRTAIFLIDHLKSSSSIKGRGKIETDFKPESVLRINTSDEDQFVLYAEKLVRESSAWYRKNLDGPRTVIDWPFLTDKEVRASREESLASVLDHLGQNLMLQNRQEEALQVFKEAVDLARRKQSSINEHYIESLIKSNRIDVAKEEAAIVIGLGKSTAAISSFHESIVSDTLPKTVAVAALRSKLKEQMLSDEVAGGMLLNASGEKVFLKELKGKVVVIDFWATWCAPCLIGIESAVEVVTKYKNRTDVIFLFVNTELITEESRRRVNRILHEMDFSFNVFFDPGLKTTKTFKVEALPTIIILDRDGKIRFRHTGMNVKWGKQERVNELTAMIELAR